MSLQDKYYGGKIELKALPDFCDLCGSKENVEKITDFDIRFFSDLQDKISWCGKCMMKSYTSWQINLNRG